MSAMSEATILTHFDETTGVATLTLNRPELHNAFDDELVNQLTYELKRLDTDPTINVVMLAANGKSFSAGADLNWLQRIAEYSKEENLQDTRQLAELMATLSGLSKPTVAKIQGSAFGGGIGLVACCDMAIASDAASFCLSEVSLGLIPAVVAPYVVNAIGERHARRYFLTAERFSAQEAQRIGLVHEVVPHVSLDGTVTKLLTTLIGNGPTAMRAAKDLILLTSPNPSIGQSLIEVTAQRLAEIRTSEEGQEGINAFLEKRSPSWVPD